MGENSEHREKAECAARLVEARKAANFRGPQAVHDAFGFDVNKYKAHEQGRNGFGIADARAYAEAFGVRLEWLNFGTGPREEPRELEYVPLEAEWTPDPDSDGEGYDGENYRPKIEGAIPELDAKAGAGEGAVGEVVVLPMMGGTKSGHRVIDEWRIPPDYLREAVRDPERAIVLPIAGDSMLPNYAPGDRVVIDLTEHELRVDGVYLISDGVSPPQIKRLQRLQFTNPPRCRIISDNPIYPATEIEVDLVHIMGKVSAYVGRR